MFEFSVEEFSTLNASCSLRPQHSCCCARVGNWTVRLWLTSCWSRVLLRPGPPLIPIHLRSGAAAISHLDWQVLSSQGDHDFDWREGPAGFVGLYGRSHGILRNAKWATLVGNLTELLHIESTPKFARKPSLLPILHNSSTNVMAVIAIGKDNHKIFTEFLRTRLCSQAAAWRLRCVFFCQNTGWNEFKWIEL